MTKNKKFAFAALAVICALCLSLAFAACGKNREKNTGTSDAGTYGAGEEGDYYWDYDEGTEYILSLRSGMYTMTMGKETTTSEGTYLYFAEKGTITFTATTGDTYNGTFSAGNINFVSSGGNSYLFQPRVERTVTFVVNGVEYTQGVRYGKTATSFTPEVDEGYVFMGWYTDVAFKNAYVFGTAVTADLTLYARIEVIDPTIPAYTVTFVNGDDITTSETVNGVITEFPEGSDGILGWWVCLDGDTSKPTHVYGGEVLSGSTTLVAYTDTTALGASVYDDKVTLVNTPSSWTLKVIDSSGEEVHSASRLTSSSYSYDFSSLPGGEYSVVVTANSYNVETVYYVSGALPKVSVIFVQGWCLVFGTVTGAESYRIAVSYEGASYEVTMEANGSEYLSYDLSGLTMPKGGITFVIYAEAEELTSSASDAYVFFRELDKISDLTIDASSDEAVWSAVADAEYYEVTVTTGGVSVTERVTEPGYSFKYCGIDSEITVTVRPVATLWYSDESSTAETYTKTTLAAPKNVSVSGYTVSWDAVEGGDVSGYTVSFNGEEIAVPSGTSLDLTGRTVLDTNEIKVKAVHSDASKSSQWSDTLTVSGGEDAETAVTYAGDGLVTWDYIFGVSGYTLTVGSGSSVTLTTNRCDVTFTASGDTTITLSWTSPSGTEKTASTSVFVYALSFDAQGGNAVATQYLVYGDTIHFPDATYPDADYTFGGWYTQPHTGGVDPESYVGTGYAITDGQAFTFTTNTTLYAYWQALRINVALNLADGGAIVDGGGNEISSTTYTTTIAKGSSTFTLPVPVSSDPAYVFVGWFTSPLDQDNFQYHDRASNNYYAKDTEDSRRYTDLEGNAFRTFSSTQSVTLYAGWIRIVDIEATSLTYDGMPVASVQLVVVEEEDAQGQALQEYSFLLADWYEITEYTVPETYVINGTTYLVGYYGAASFNDWTCLTTLNIPDTAVLISVSGDGYSEGNGAFAGDENLEAVNVYFTDYHNPSDPVQYFSDGGVLYEFDQAYGTTSLVYFPQGKSGDYVIPSYLCDDRETDTYGQPVYRAVDTIPANVFTGKNIGKITVPSTVTTVKTNAFYNSTVTEIAFVEGTAGTLTLEDGAFENSKYLTTVNIPAQLTVFNPAAFTGCTALVNLTVSTAAANATGYSVTGGVLFKNTSTLVYYPLGLSFTDGTYDIPSSVTTIGAAAFASTSVQTITIPASVTKIEEGAFQGCTSLTTLKFAGSSQSNSLEIEAKAFYDCSSLSSSGDSDHAGYLVLPVNLVKLGANSFGKTAVTKVYFDCVGGAALNFADYAFSSEGAARADSKVTTLDLGEYVPEMPFKSIFGGTSSMTVNIDSGNKNYYKDDSTGAIYGAVSKNLIYIPSSASGAFTFAEGYEPTVIYADTFAGTDITSITIPATVVEIDSSAFYGCSKLASVTFAKPSDDASNHTLRMGDYVFYNCVALTSITLPGYIESMGNEVFYGCNALRTVSIDGYEDGGNNGHYGTLSGILYEFAGSGDSAYATRIILSPRGNSVAELQIYATIPGIDADFFRYFNDVTEVEFIGTASSSFYIAEGAFSGNTTIKKVTLPEGLDTIATGTFQNTRALETIIIPTTVTTIESSAFLNSNVSEVVFTGVEEDQRDGILIFLGTGTSTGDNQEDGAFYGCSNLKSIALPKNTVLVKYTFAYSGLEEITIPGGGQSGIADHAFFYCTDLEKITIGEGITSIGNQAFAYCSNVKYLSIPSTLTSINFENAFYMCANPSDNFTYYFDVADGNSAYAAVDGVLYGKTNGTITSIEKWSKYTTTTTIPAGISSIPADLFDGSSIENLSFAGPVTFSGVTSTSNPFLNCASLKSVTFAEGQTSIPDYLFQNTTIETVTMPSTITSIGKYAFSGSNLKAVNFTEGGSSNLTIGEAAFKNTKLTSVSVPGRATTLSASVFEGCTSLTTATFGSGITSVPENAFYGCTALTSVGIPSTVLSIGARAFYHCEKLGGVTFSGGLTDIGASAFEGCTSLSSVQIPSSVTAIGASAFSGCTALSCVTFSVDSDGKCSLEGIGDYAFAYTAITTFSFPETTTGSINLGSRLFRDCALQELYISSSVTNVGSALSSCTVAKFTVAEGNEHYKTNEDYTELLDMSGKLVKGQPVEGAIEIDDDATEIGDYEYYGESSAKSVEIPASVTKIGDYAFAGCTSLETVTFENGASVTIGAHAFDGCVSLTSIDLSSVKSVGDYAFYGCGLETLEVTALTSVGEYAFAGNGELATLTFVSGAKFGDHMFDGDVMVTTVDLSGVTSLSGAYVFSNCSALSEVVWGTGSNVPAYFFADCTGLEKLTDSSGGDASVNITGIGEYAFYGCTALNTFTLNYTLTSLPAHAFDGCSAVTLDISHITSVGSYALSHCGIAENSATEQITSLSEGAFAYSVIKSFTMGSSLERSIPAYAFRGSSLSSFTPTKATSKFTIGKAAFAGCSELKSFSLGSLYSSTPSGTAIPILNDYAFAGSGITEFTYNIGCDINSAVWGSYVFAYCADLTTVTLDTGSKGLSVFPYMFAYCTSLKTVTLRDVYTMIIWDGAFQYCTAMEEITITSMKLCAWPSTSAAADAGTMETGIFDGWGTTNLTQYINVTTSYKGNNWDGGIGSNVVYGAKP